jgi:hypothetical protein
MAIPAQAVHLPRWSKRVVTEVGGRDPLGLSRVSSLITDYLLTGITTQTSRARYYSFYPWALWHIENSEAPKKYNDFNYAFRRREAFMALCTLDGNPESSVVGDRVVRPRLEKVKETSEVGINFKVLPSNEMGGYGQYYGGSLYQLGLTSRNEEGIERCAPGNAVELAKAFHEAVRESIFCKGRHYEHSSFPVKVLKQSEKSFSLDALSEPFAKRERQLLLNLLFGWEKSQESETDVLRRDTLTSLLHFVRQYNRVGFEPPLWDTDKYLVRAPHYYEVLWPEDKKASSCEMPADLNVCHGFWRHFCVHQYLTQALEHLMTAVLESVADTSAGMEAESVCKILSGRNFTSKLQSIFGDGATPGKVLKQLHIQEVPSESQCLEAQKILGATNKLNEENILALSNGPPETSTAVAVALLVVLFAKWRNYSDKFSDYIYSNAGPNLFAAPVLNSMDEWLTPGLTWEIALLHLIERFVLQQHDRVMYEKGRLESSWFHWVDNKIVKDQDYSPGFRASRHWNCVLIMADLGLIRINEGDDRGVSLTSEGRAALSRLLASHEN